MAPNFSRELTARFLPIFVKKNIKKFEHCLKNLKIEKKIKYCIYRRFKFYQISIEKK